MTGNDAEVMFPAISVARTTTVFAPGVSVTVHGKVAAMPLQVSPARPESASDADPARINCGVAVVAGGGVTLRISGVLSMRRVSEAVAELPELSATLREMV